MKLENRYFDLTPRVVRADAETTIEIAPRFEHCAFRNDTIYEVTYSPVEEFSERSGWNWNCPVKVVPVDGRLRISQYFEGEQEHVLFIEEVLPDQRKRVGDFRVYSLKPDLFARKPYKGDFHMHTCRSDGWETPAYVAGACRRIGLDFVAMTDHRQFAPSLEAQNAFCAVDIDLRLFTGEEVHPPDNPAHMVNFGGQFSINDRFADASYRSEVQAIEDKLGPLPHGVDRYQYASCCWCFDKIREAEGLGVFCHPYWFTQHRYSPSGALTAYLFETHPFDAFEMIGGFHHWEIDSNTLQVARYHDERALGRTFPIVGASDSHGCERGEFFGWFYSIVFAPSPERADIIAGVKDLYSVAIEAIPKETPRAFGPFRLVKYALFLMREILPQHDELCVEEGRLMIEHAAGDASAAEAIGRLKGRTRALLDRYWQAEA